LARGKTMTAWSSRNWRLAVSWKDGMGKRWRTSILEEEPPIDRTEDRGESR